MSSQTVVVESKQIDADTASHASAQNRVDLYGDIGRRVDLPISIETLDLLAQAVLDDRGRQIAAGPLHQ